MLQKEWWSLYVDPPKKMVSCAIPSGVETEEQIQTILCRAVQASWTQNILISSQIFTPIHFVHKALQIDAILHTPPPPPRFLLRKVGSPRVYLLCPLS